MLPQTNGYTQVQTLYKFLHTDGVEYAWIVDDEGCWACVTQAELDEINYAAMFGDDPEQCTCSPFIEGLCPSCLAENE